MIRYIYGCFATAKLIRAVARCDGRPLTSDNMCYNQGPIFIVKIKCAVVNCNSQLSNTQIVLSYYSTRQIKLANSTLL